MANTATYANGAAPKGNRDKVHFPTNIPTAITLEDGEGVLQAGAYGDQYRYWLMDNQIAWLEPSVHEQIQALRPGPYDTFFITKSETRKGTRRLITWGVEKMEEEPAEEIEPPAYVAQAMAEEERQPQRRPPAQAETLAAPAAAPSGPRLVADPQERPQLTAQHAAEAQLTECLLAAIRAARAAEVYAQGQELAIRWTSEDVRAFALSVYIDARKGAR